MTAKTSNATISEQARRFAEKARELGCDEDPEAFERAVKKLARQRRPRSDVPPKRDHQSDNNK